MTKAKESGEDRRRYPRAPVSLLIQYRFDTLEDFLAEYSTDVSIGGMFIRTQDVREEGSLIYLQFCLRDGAKLIEGLGRVVRINPATDDEPGGMGVEFVNFDDESMKLIAQIVKGNRVAEGSS
ncbi:MAG: TIGR02266 family protein [Deltaproteobacteria bacterium]|nr:TIGR02266 family protein [Deltaproteobacteria bacterium]